MEDRTSPHSPTSTALVYSPAARAFHWLTVAAVAVMIPLGLYMVGRGNATNFDALTNRLYDTHKTLGACVLILIVLRLLYRLSHGAPPDEPTLAWWQRAAAHLTHWGLYGLLLLVPMLGWYAVSLYGARSLFGIVTLPALAAENQDAATRVFTLHFWAAMALLAMLVPHIGAAFYHHFIRGDGVLRRMLPNLRQR